MSWETWEWDETLFEGCAPYYEQGRPPYAPGVADALRDALGLDGRGRLLDAGCGPGRATLLALASVRRGRRSRPRSGDDRRGGTLALTELHITNAHFVRERAEALPAGLGTFRVVTFAASFHWMDRPVVAAAVRTMLEPGGAAVQIDPPGYGPSNEVVRDGASAVPRRRPASRAGRSATPRRTGRTTCSRPRAFVPMDVVTVPDGRVIERPVDDLVAQALSSSSTAPHLFGDRLDDFVADLRAALLDAHPSGFAELALPDNQLRIWRPR